MRTTARALVLTAALAATWLSLPAEPANASHGWALSGSFTVGRADFGVYYRPGYLGDFYFRVAQPLSHPGYRCHERCYLDRGHTYHYARCPLVHRHFRAHRFSAAPILDALFFPARYSYRGADRRSDDRYRGEAYRRDHDRGRDRYGRQDRFGYRDHDSDSDSDRRQRGRYGDGDSDSDSDHDRRRHH